VRGGARGVRGGRRRAPAAPAAAAACAAAALSRAGADTPLAAAVARAPAAASAAAVAAAAAGDRAGGRRSTPAAPAACRCCRGWVSRRCSLALRITPARGRCSGAAAVLGAASVRVCIASGHMTPACLGVITATTALAWGRRSSCPPPCGSSALVAAPARVRHFTVAAAAFAVAAAAATGLGRCSRRRSPAVPRL
jgi:hypothetical protein